MIDCRYFAFGLALILTPCSMTLADARADPRLSNSLGASDLDEIRAQVQINRGSEDLPPVQQAYLKASNTDEGDRFAWDGAVAVDGDTVVIGAHYEGSDSTGISGDEANNDADRSGAVYVFVRSGGSWSQQAYLKASNTNALDQFGRSVAIDGDTIVVGAKFESSNATGVNGDQDNNIASASGAAYVFVRSGGSWSQQAYLKASNTGFVDQFGISVAIDGDTVAIGAPSEDSNAKGVNGDQSNNLASDSGAVYVFVRNGGSWSQQAYIKASNTDAADEFGSVVALSGDTLSVSARFEDSKTTSVNGNDNDNDAEDAGAVYVFFRSEDNWSQQAYLKASNAEAGDIFGHSIAIDEDTIVVGAHLEDSNAMGVSGDESNNDAEFAGAAYVFTRSGGDWSQQAYLKASNNEEDDRFGTAAAVYGDTLVISSFEGSNATGVNGNQTINFASRSGAAYMFTRSANSWTQQAYLKASNTEVQDQFGASMALAQDTVVIGARFEDSNATGVNGDQANNEADGAGSAYVFDLAPIADTVFVDRFRSTP